MNQKPTQNTIEAANRWQSVFLPDVNRAVFSHVTKPTRGLKATAHFRYYDKDVSQLSEEELGGLRFRMRSVHYQLVDLATAPSMALGVLSDQALSSTENFIEYLNEMGYDYSEDDLELVTEENGDKLAVAKPGSLFCTGQRLVYTVPQT